VKTFPRKTRTCLAAGAAALTLGCAGDASPPNTAGVVSFSYSGAASGTFNATGSQPASAAEFETKPWGAGHLFTGGDGSSVTSVAPRNSTTHDYLVVLIPANSPSTSQIDFDNCTANVCASVFFVLARANASDAVFEQDCYLQTGSITITSVTSSRMQGTFSGNGTCETQAGATSSVVVTNGAFDVPILASFD
jgi:hypothetical protein